MEHLLPYMQQWKYNTFTFYIPVMEETGKKVFLPVSSGRKRKKLEEIHVINSACKQSVGKKFPDTVK